ncbi:MAG: SRPBCC family protein [Rhizomicrobium sp.]
MSKTIVIAPVRKSLTVNATQARAFEVFTNGIDRWWPKGHSIGATPLRRSVIEPRQGGRWYTVHEDGSEAVVGHMLVWEPPVRIVFSWEIDAQWKPDATVASEVEVTFTPEGPNVTRVDLDHRGFESLGQEGGGKMRGAVDGGWPGILELFKSEAER